MLNPFKVNDLVVYTREKHSLSPGRRAKNITPSPHGELYSYEVDKYWIVREVKDDALVLETRTGKKHTLKQTDPRLRKATFFEKLVYPARFPQKPGSDKPLHGSSPSIG